MAVVHNAELMDPIADGGESAKSLNARAWIGPSPIAGGLLASSGEGFCHSPSCYSSPENDAKTNT